MCDYGFTDWMLLALAIAGGGALGLAVVGALVCIVIGVLASLD